MSSESCSCLSFSLPSLSQLGTLFKYLYTPDLWFGLILWLFSLFCYLPGTSLHFSVPPSRLQYVFRSEYSFLCPHYALGLWGSVDLDQDLKSLPRPWEHSSCEPLPVEPGFPNCWKASGRLAEGTG